MYEIKNGTRYDKLYSDPNRKKQSKLKPSNIKKRGVDDCSFL